MQFGGARKTPFLRENCMQFRSKNVTGRENRPWVSLTIAHGYMRL